MAMKKYLWKDPMKDRWSQMTPWTRRIIIICLTVIIIAAMRTGNAEALMKLLIGWI